MAYDSRQARSDLLDDLAGATEAIGSALAGLGSAYDQLDERTADRLEEELFRPVQLAYGRARRTHAGFAERHGLPGRTFEAAPVSGGQHGARAPLDRALESVAEAEHALAEIQDSMMPVEVGDAELRAGLAEVRALIAPLPDRAREIVRVLGR